MKINNIRFLFTGTSDTLTLAGEIYPIKDPNPENAIKLTDSVFYNSKGREIKRPHFNRNLKESWSEKFQYSKNGYTKKVSGNRTDISVFHVYSKLEKLANKKHIDFEFKDATNHTYEFNYH